MNFAMLLLEIKEKIFHTVRCDKELLKINFKCAVVGIKKIVLLNLAAYINKVHKYEQRQIYHRKMYSI